MKRFALILLAVAAVCAAAPARVLPLPQVPASVASAQGRADYALGHYWDALTAADVTASGGRDIERSLLTFLELLPQGTPQGRRAAAVRLLEKAAAVPPMPDVLADLTERYLWDPESPRCDLDTYLLLAEPMQHFPTGDKAAALRLSERVRLLIPNRPGSKAVDFTMTLPDGSTRRLGDLQGKPLTLIFYDPGCGSCVKALKELASRPGRVVAVCLDAEPPQWRKFIENYPAEWLHGLVSDTEDAESSIYSKYFLDRVPAVLMLGADGTVLRRSWVNLPDADGTEN